MKLRTFIVMSALLTLPTASLAADLYVSTTGNDSSSGTQLAPYRTISHAAQYAKAGTVVHVAAGVYNGNVKTSLSGNSTARIRFVSDSKWGAKVVGTGTGAMWLNSGSYVDIVGFDVSGPGRLGIQNDGSYTLIMGNHVHDLKVSGGCTGSGGAGIDDSNYNASNADIVGNVVHDVGTPGGCNGVQGIYHAHRGGHIFNNVVYRASAFGIHLWHAADQVTVMNNTVFNNGSSSMGGGIVAGRGDAGAGVLTKTIIANNIVYNNPRSGIWQYCYAGVACIGNDNVTANNLVYGNGGGASQISLKVGTATGTISADPQFVNYQANGSGDYHLKSTSPAIDKGILLAGVPTDLEGKARVVGAAIDIGAYENGSSVPVTPSPSPTPAPTPSPTPIPPPTPVAAVSLSAKSLAFSASAVGATSAIQVVTLKNTGSVAFTIPAGFIITGDFAFGGTGTCTTSVSYAPGATCTVSLVFKPTMAGPRTGTLSIRTSASAGSQLVSLSGAVNATVAVSVSRSSLSFGTIAVGAKSAIQTVVIKNTGTTAMKFPKAFAISGDFTFGGTGTCTVSAVYAPGASCTASVVFTPRAKGARHGLLTIVANVSSPAWTVRLYGTGK